MKKILSAYMLVLLLVLLGCSSDSDDSNEASEDKSGDEVSTNYPEEKIEIINPFPAGGATDTLSRAIAKVLPKYLPHEQQVVVENNPLGGVGTIGTTKLINSKPDGYTVALTPVSTLAVQPHLGQVDYSYDDVDPVVEVSSSEGMLVVPEDAPYETIEDWLDYVKENPGTFKYSTSGAGSLQHIQAEALINAEDLDISHVPYDGTAESTTALLGGHVDGAIMQASQSREHIEAGKLKPLVFLGSSKAEGFEDLPLLQDVGIDVAIDNFTVIFAPKDIPEDVFAILEKGFQDALQDEEVLTIIHNMGDTPQTTIGQDLFEKVETTFNLSGEAMKASGLAD